VIYSSRGEPAGYSVFRQDASGYEGASDTYIVSDQFPSEGPSTPHGAAEVLNLGCDGRRKTLLHFDVSSLPEGVVIKGARLTLHLLEQRVVPLQVNVYELLRPWRGSDATWTLATAEQPWAVAGAEGVGTDRASAPYKAMTNVKVLGPHVLNVKTLIDRWIANPSGNLGVLLIGSASCTSSTRYPFGSAENPDSSKRPLLEVWHTEPMPTPTSTPVACSLEGTVQLQGRPGAPNPLGAVPLTVTVGEITHNVTADEAGRFSLTGLPCGTYDVTVKSEQALSKRHGDALFSSGIATVIDFGVLLVGDANGDDRVNINDFSILATGFYPAFDNRADFNGDGVVNISDFSLLASNFGKAGDAAATANGVGSPAIADAR